MTGRISYEDFRKVDMRVGRIVKVEDFPEAHKPAFKLWIDFGSGIGVKRSSAQLMQEHGREELLGRQVVAVVNFHPKRIADFESEVLTLGFPGASGGWVVISPAKEVKLGERLE